MIRQTKGKMFLADERGLHETEWLRSWSTFNFGRYFSEHKHPFGDIYVVNDDILDGSRSLRMIIEEHSYVILLPVAGAIAYKDSSGNKNLIAAGQAQVLELAKDATIDITNPFKEGLVNFLQIWIRAEKINETTTSNLLTYDINEYLDSFIEISPQNPGVSPLPFTVSIGKFSGRGETIYKLSNKNSGLFAFVIEGAFEVEGRLLHARDGLTLWETEEAEMEALSNDAIVLLIELPLK
jgi:redox-sensitive bicupin YhaK (pirin superfamily)